MSQNTNKKNTPPPIVFIILFILIGFGAYKFLPSLFKAKNSEPAGALANRFSLGNQSVQSRKSDITDISNHRRKASRSYSFCQRKLPRSYPKISGFAATKSQRPGNCNLFE